MKPIEIVTNRLMELIETTQVLPWQKPWRVASQAPRNIKGREYTGINALMLAYSGYEDKRFLTYNQAKELGGEVKGDAERWPVLFVKREPYEKRLADGTKEERMGYLMRYYTVVNASDCEGLPKPEPINPEILSAERIVKGYESRGPVVKHGYQHAHYMPAVDRIEMPKRNSFVSSAAYYNVLFHELVHSTGAASRLNRTFGKRHGDDAYRAEELVAEIGACGLDHMSGIYEQIERNSVAYLQSWLGKLKEDPTVLVTAASQSDKAINFILGR